MRAEDDAVEGRRPPTSRGARPARGGRTAPAGAAPVRPPSSSTANSSQASPGQPHLGPQPQQPAVARAPRPARSRAARPPRSRSGSRRPRRRPTPPTRRSSRPRTAQARGTSTSRGRRRCPRSAATASAAVGVAPRSRARRGRRCRRSSRDRWASGRWARRARPRPTTGWRRRPSRICSSASRTASSKPAARSSGTSVGDVVLVDHDRVAQRLDQRAGRWPSGTGVTRLTHWLDSHGVRTGTGMIIRRPQPGHRGVALHHLPVGQDVGPADVEAAVGVRREVEHADEVVQDVATAIGWTRESTHFGVTITGSRSVR